MLILVCLFIAILINVIWFSQRCSHLAEITLSFICSRSFLINFLFFFFFTTAINTTQFVHYLHASGCSSKGQWQGHYTSDNLSQHFQKYRRFFQASSEITSFHRASSWSDIPVKFFMLFYFHNLKTLSAVLPHSEMILKKKYIITFDSYCSSVV